MSGLTFIISNDYQRMRAIKFLQKCQPGTVITAKPSLRTIPQNDKMWAEIGELAQAKPEGRSHPPHVWKALVMDMAGCKPQWERSLEGDGVVCVGYKSSRLNKQEMSDVLEALHAYAAMHGIQLRAA